jgi:hypothetical protein
MVMGSDISLRRKLLDLSLQLVLPNCELEATPSLLEFSFLQVALCCSSTVHVGLNSHASSRQSYQYSLRCSSTR